MTIEIVVYYDFYGYDSLTDSFVFGLALHQFFHGGEFALGFSCHGLLIWTILSSKAGVSV